MTPLPATDAEFRAAGYTSNARNFPLSDAGARWVAAFNGIDFDKMPPAWHYAPNAGMRDYVEQIAAENQSPEAYTQS